MKIMKNNMISLALDDATLKNLDNYGQLHSISRSATIRLILTKFFLKEDNQ